MVITKFIIVLLLAYLLGAIPFGKIVARFFANVDITQHGSGNIGGTNVLRLLGMGPASLVIAGDLGKAFFSVMLARMLVGEGWYLYAGFPPQSDYLAIVAEVSAAFTCMIGHNWSAYIKFRGGKGVAAYFGGWIAMFLLIAGIGAIILIPTVIITRQMSKGSILASIGTVCALMVLTLFYAISPIYLIYAVIAAAIIVFQHRRNISRLQNGTELEIYGDKHIRYKNADKERRG